MRYCSIHRLDYVAQCDPCAASRDRKKRDEDKMVDDDPIQLKKMLALRKRLDPDAPDVIAFPARVVNRAYKESIINTAVEAQRLADAVVEAAIDWHKSDMEESMDAAQTLEDAIDALLDFRRKMPIVKTR